MCCPRPPAIPATSPWPRTRRLWRPYMHRPSRKESGSLVRKAPRLLARHRILASFSCRWECARKPKLHCGSRLGGCSGDPEAEPVLRRALPIQQTARGADARVTIVVLNTLGNLLQGRGQLEEAEKLIRTALALSEAKFGPESPQLAVS